MYEVMGKALDILLVGKFTVRYCTGPGSHLSEPARGFSVLATAGGYQYPPVNFQAGMQHVWRLRSHDQRKAQGPSRSI
jgi:hypothetical protein